MNTVHDKNTVYLHFTSIYEMYQKCRLRFPLQMLIASFRINTKGVYGKETAPG